MPMKAARICSCGARVAHGVTCACVKARKTEHDRNRPNSADRGYDAEWRAFRAAYLRDHPQCTEPGCTEPATEVDHILSVKQRPDLRLKRFNCRSFCKPHHSRRTARDQAFGRGASQTFADRQMTDALSQNEKISNSAQSREFTPSVETEHECVDAGRN